MPTPKKMEGNPDANLTSVGNYNFMKTLGEGNFAKVKLAKHKVTGQEVAIKIIDKMQLDQDSLSKLYREVRILKLLHHPNIVKIYEVVETKFTMFIVMEYVQGGELYDYLVVHGRMKEKEARAKFRDIISAVSYCHRKRVVHRDLKAENLLLDNDMNVKVADFGFSNSFDPDGKLETFCGSPPYAAPELFQGKRYTGPEVDVWSLGVILYVLCTGCLPFEGKNLQEMRDSVCRGKYRVPFYLSESCERLLRKFLVRDPVKRPTLDILVDDEWLNEGYNRSCVTKEVNDQLVSEDPMVLKIMEQKFGFSKHSVLEGLKNNVHDEQMAVYFLLYNEKVAHGEAGLAKISEQMAAAYKPVVHHPQPTPTISIIKEESQESVNREGNSKEGVSKEPVIHEQPEVVVVVPRRRSSINPDALPRGPPPAASSGAATKVINHPAPVQTNPATQQVKRTRRNTVSGQQQDEVADQITVLQQKAAAMVVEDNEQEDSMTSTMPRPQPREQPVKVNPNRRASVAVTDANHDASLAKIAAANQKAIQNQKQTFSIFGKRRTSEEKEQSKPAAKPASKGEEAGSEEAHATTSNGPRSLRFTFASNTTSSKDPSVLMQELLVACAQLQIAAKQVAPFHLECSAQPPSNSPGARLILFEVEICKLPRLKNLHGLKLNRMSGASNDYKAVCDLLLGCLQL